ncbi:hypothetical protein ACFX2G_044223 [Malus domestica]
MESSKVSEGEIVSPIIFDGNTSTSLCCFPVMGPSESSSSGVAADVTKCQCSSGQGDSPASLIEMNCDAVKAQNHDEISGIVCNDGQDCDPLNSGLAPNDTVEVAASPTDLDHGICPRGCSTDAAVCNDETESKVLDPDGIDSQDNSDSGDWMVILGFLLHEK